ncbi:hypothetical protein Bca52824_035783 [Brassica carinata]|uniref:Uncharacterized protein n=1 Tax=Brassica carinata TaxID=52824 RepID=A0A8X7V336_BRACI|nr:hypothetical protein Bca52824_035783 [Brassica carinata]
MFRLQNSQWFLCLKWLSPFAPWREAHSGDGFIALYLLGEGRFPEARAMDRLGQKASVAMASLRHAMGTICKPD